MNHYTYQISIIDDVHKLFYGNQISIITDDDKREREAFIYFLNQAQYQGYSFVDLETGQMMSSQQLLCLSIRNILETMNEDNKKMR